jgi:hypothetical protein
MREQVAHGSLPAGPRFSKRYTGRRALTMLLNITSLAVRRRGKANILDAMIGALGA